MLTIKRHWRDWTNRFEWLHETDSLIFMMLNSSEHPTRLETEIPKNARWLVFTKCKILPISILARKVFSAFRALEALEALSGKCRVYDALGYRSYNRHRKLKILRRILKGIVLSVKILFSKVVSWLQKWAS